MQTAAARGRPSNQGSQELPAGAHASWGRAWLTEQRKLDAHGTVPPGLVSFVPHFQPLPAASGAPSAGCFQQPGPSTGAAGQHQADSLFSQSSHRDGPLRPRGQQVAALAPARPGLDDDNGLQQLQQWHAAAAPSSTLAAPVHERDDGPLPAEYPEYPTTADNLALMARAAHPCLTFFQRRKKKKSKAKGQLTRMRVGGAAFFRRLLGGCK